MRNVTLIDLWNALESRFGCPMEIDLAKQQLSVYKQRRDQSFSHLAMDIQRLVFLSFPNGNDEIRNDIALEYFIRAISSQQLRYQVKLMAPRNINEARTHAERIFSIMSSETSNRNVLMCNFGEVNENKFVNYNPNNQNAHSSYRNYQSTNNYRGYNYHQDNAQSYQRPNYEYQAPREPQRQNTRTYNPNQNANRYSQDTRAQQNSNQFQRFNPEQNERGLKD